METEELCEAAGQKVLDHKNNWEPKKLEKVDFLTMFALRLSDLYVWNSNYLRSR